MDHPTILGYLKDLEPWESDLYGTYELLVSQADLLEMLASEALIFSSDGSAQEEKASFGWILATTQGMRLLKISGPALGKKPTSYRAEGYGVLSVYRFIYRVKSYFLDGRVLPKHTVICDNQSMVGQTSSLPPTWEKVPNKSKASDWDVLAQIWETLNLLAEVERPRVEHIKGHQDDHKPYDSLSLKAQLNCDADELADRYINTHPNRDYSQAHVFPANGALLELPGGSVTHNIKRELKEARTRPMLEQYIMKKEFWTEETFHKVAWEPHRRAINRNSKIRVALIKHLIDWSPTGDRVNRYDVKYNPACPSCPLTGKRIHMFTPAQEGLT